jgi:uncharacterized protein with GYD domain
MKSYQNLYKIFGIPPWLPAILCFLISVSACQHEKRQSDREISQQKKMSQEVNHQQQSKKKENVTMNLYITRFSYTPETWARMMKNPEDRREAARKYIESVGGKLHGFWYSFGEYDGYNLWEAPDNVSMAAVAFAITGGGALSKFETTPLLTVDETLEALRRAQNVGYQLPGNK